MLEDYLKYSDFVLTFIILPLIGWIWKTDRKTLILETKRFQVGMATLLHLKMSITIWLFLIIMLIFFKVI